VRRGDEPAVRREEINEASSWKEYLLLDILLGTVLFILDITAAVLHARGSHTYSFCCSRACFCALQADAQLGYFYKRYGTSYLCCRNVRSRICMVIS
jgi:hypothetical protein